MTLVLGCGRTGHARPDVVTLDADARLQPDIRCTLGVDPIPLAENSVDHATAIHVLEHIGRQGETAEWFQFWEELYRVLKPGASLFFEAPLYSSVWAWADPSHTRALSPEAFVFLSQASYRLTPSSISPYRIHCDFVPQPYHALGDHFQGVLIAQKPLRVWWAA